MNASKIIRGIALALGTCTLALVLAGCSGGGAATAASEHSITVSSSSETKIVPDKARMGVSVVTEGKTADQCQSDNAESTNAVIEALAKLGVEDKSIQTNYSNLSPRYGSVSSSGKNDSDDAEYDEWKITGYEMTTSLTVSDLEIDNVGAVMQACVAAGANATDGIEYYASNYDEAYGEALAKALETAKSKADGIASAADVKLGKVINVEEGYQDTSARYVTSYNDIDAEESADGAAMAAKAMPGQVDISASVTVTYAIS